MITLIRHLLFPVALLLATGADAQEATPETLPSGVTRVAPAELKITRDYIVAGWLDTPLPQGVVDVNPPWLHVAVPLLSGTESTNQARKAKTSAQKWKRRFYFKLSQDPQLKQGVMESGPKRWSFYNPYQRLAAGTWYWTYGVAPGESPDKPEWCGKTYSFQISGNEFAGPIPPTPEVLLTELKKRKQGPVTVCTQEDIGHLMPTQTWPALAEQIESDRIKALKSGEKPVAIEIDDKKFPAYMKKPTPVYFVSQMRTQLTQEGRRCMALLYGYLITGDSKCKELGIKRAIELENLRRTAHWNILGEDVTLASHSSPGALAVTLLDAFYDDLPKDQQNAYMDMVYQSICDNGTYSPNLHEMLEHQSYDNHAWQGGVSSLLAGSMILCRYRPELDDWVKYAYELFLYRAPGFSRTDGGSSEGNGYLGVHDEPLTHIPWMLYRLTGHNFYKDKPWFQNFSRYMSLANLPGNPGISFEDAGEDGGSDLPYLSEALARMCPDNVANLWQHKSVGRRPANYFSADINKGNKALDLLSLWSRFPDPDMTKAKPPETLAAAFGDIGLVSMHTNLAKASGNLMVNFRAGPYGSGQHTHPAQNAFTLAYGGEPLFWRTGYYNGGGDHNVFSYKSSRAHNTILADGLVQGFDESAYAWIARFAHGERISYALGDASNAYNGKHDYFSIPYEPDKKFTNKVEARRNWSGATRENGFGNPGVTRFRRHMVLLRPSHVLIYDELEAKSPITWTFQLGSRLEMKQLGDAWFKTANPHALGTAQLFCASPVKGSLTDQFMGPAVDEENKRKGKNPPNWHAKITTRDRLPATRFLTVLEILPGKTLADTLVETTSRNTGGRAEIQIGDYLVTAELDATKPSYLEVHDRAGTCALVTGQASRDITLGSTRRSARIPGSTLLWEGQNPHHAEIFLEKTDELPDCLKFGNRY